MSTGLPLPGEPRVPRCTICWHPDRPAIEQMIINGRTLRSIAEQWGFTYIRKADGKVMGDHKRIAHHRDKCMARDYAVAVTESREATGQALTARLDELDRHIDTVLARRLAGTPVIVDGVAVLSADGTPMIEYHDALILRAVREARQNLLARWQLASGLPEPDKDAMETARKAMADPSVRSLLQRVEEALAATDGG